MATEVTDEGVRRNHVIRIVIEALCGQGVDGAVGFGLGSGGTTISESEVAMAGR